MSTNLRLVSGDQIITLVSSEPEARSRESGDQESELTRAV